MSIGEEQVECPLCMEPLELDDINFYPCTCGYQICRFCWNRIRTDENGLCPACRKSYPEDPAAFKPLTEDELQRIKRERKMKDLQRKQKAAENRKHLANVRVVQKNLVFAVGLSQRLADTEVLKKHDYFGKFGKIVKVVINQSTSYAGSQCSQGPSASAYITYHKAEDALRAIQAVNNIHVDGRTIKASLGTTKYCSHFLRGTQCPKPDCMYLHELGDEAASFTKEEMQQGKHQEYEQKLYEQYMNSLNTTNHTPAAGGGGAQQTQTTKQTSSRKKTHSPATTQRQTPPQSASQNHSPDAWPSLHTGQGQSKSSTDSRTTNSNNKGPTASSHSSNLSSSFGSSSTLSSSSQHSGATHKRNHSSDLHLTGGTGGNNTGRGGGQRQTRTPDPHTASRAQHSVVTDSNNSSQQPPQPQQSQLQQPQPPQHNQQQPPQTTHNHQTNLPTGATTTLPGGGGGSVVNNCTPPPASSSQISPPQIQTPPSSQLNRHQTTTHTLAASPQSPHTHTMAPQRKPLYGDSNSESLSLFSNSGFPVNRSVLNKHPSAVAAAAALSSSGATGEEGAKLNGPEVIPETISVSSSTDWQAAFGFQPSSMLSSRHGNGVMTDGSAQQQQQQLQARMLSQRVADQQRLQQQSHPATDSSADDDLGFDPWNESTKALQDLIEKEAVNAASGQNHLPHHTTQQQQQQLLQQQQQAAALRSRFQPQQLPPSVHSQQMLGHDQNGSGGGKPLPPGFSHNHLGAFNQNPLLGGSRVLGKFAPSYPHNGVGGPAGSSLDSLSDLALCGGGGGGGSLPPQGLVPPSDSGFSMKNWQEGLRALLPNINIHFGNPQGGNPQGGGGPPMPLLNPPAAGASGLPQQHHPAGMQVPPGQKTAAQRSPRNSWELSSDPAVLTSGNVADGPEEPHWMASLHNLTEDTGPSLQHAHQNQPQQQSNNHPNNTYSSSRFLPFRQQQSGGGAGPQAYSPASQAPTAPPPGFQNSIRPAPQLATGMLDSQHKQLMDAFH